MDDMRNARNTATSLAAPPPPPPSSSSSTRYAKKQADKKERAFRKELEHKAACAADAALTACWSPDELISGEPLFDEVLTRFYDMVQLGHYEDNDDYWKAFILTFYPECVS